MAENDWNEELIDGDDEDNMFTSAIVKIMPVILYNVPVRANSYRHTATILVDSIRLHHHKYSKDDSYYFVGKVVENGLRVHGDPVDGYDPTPQLCEWALEAGTIIPIEWQRAP